MYPLIRRYLRRVDVFYLLLCAACSALSVVVLLSIGRRSLAATTRRRCSLSPACWG